MVQSLLLYELLLFFLFTSVSTLSEFSLLFRNLNLRSTLIGISLVLTGFPGAQIYLELKLLEDLGIFS